MMTKSLDNYKEMIESSLETTFSKLGYTFKLTYDQNVSISVDLVDDIPKNNDGFKTLGYFQGWTSQSGLIVIDALNEDCVVDITEFEHIVSHEFLHSCGLNHIWEEEETVIENNLENINNLLNSDENPDRDLRNNNGNDVTETQMKKIEESIKIDLEGIDFENE